MSVPGRRAIPTFGPPPPDSASLSQPPSSVSLPGSILPITPTSSDTPPPTQQSSTASPPTNSDSSTSSTTGTDSTGGTPTSSSTMSLDPSSAAPLPISLPSSPSPTFILPPVAATSHSNHAGAIAGGVIGGVAFIALVIGAVLLALRRHNKKRAQRTVLPWSSEGAGRRRGDVRLSSSSGLAGDGYRTSRYDFAKRMSAAGYVTAGGESLPGKVVGAGPDRRASTGSSVGAPHARRHPSVSSHTHVNSHSNEDGGYSDDDEKNSTIHNYDSSTYSHAQKSIDLNDTAIPHLPMVPPMAHPSHERSRSGHNHALALANLESTPDAAPYPNIVPPGGATVSRSPSAATYSSQKDPFASPSDKALNRMSSTGGASRRTTVSRKAVPKYDQSEFSMADMSSTTSHPSSPRAVSPAPMAHPDGVPAVAARAVSPYLLSHAGSSDSLRSGNGALLSRHGSSRSAAPLPALNHKTSFGDMRPVHYIIPDLPPQQEE